MRIFSLLLVVIALMLLGADMITSLEHQGPITTRSVADIWALFDKSSVEAFKAWTASALPGFLSAVVLGFLKIYGWAVPGVIGFVLAFVFGREPKGK